MDIPQYSGRTSEVQSVNCLLWPELNSLYACAEALLHVDTAASESRGFCGLEQPKQYFRL